jgi:hypothetical protein
LRGITESDWPRDRKRATGKCEGRKSYAEARPDTVGLAKELHANRLSYRKIAAELAARGPSDWRGQTACSIGNSENARVAACSGSGFDRRPLIRWQYDWR